jgi:hypothetical protein
MADFSDGKSKASHARDNEDENKSGDEEEKIENCTEIKERKSNSKTTIPNI